MNSCLIRILPMYLLMGLLSMPLASSQQSSANYDESKIPEFSLPDPLIGLDGLRVEDDSDWFATRRPEILELFRAQVYGRNPLAHVSVTYTQNGTHVELMGGKATMKEITISVTGRSKTVVALLLVILPNTAKPSPVFLSLNFKGNHAIMRHPLITPSPGWQSAQNPAGIDSARWPVADLIGRGYGLATLYYGDLDPDFDDGFNNGIHPLFYTEGQEKPDADEWGSIGVWAWGMMRAMDYLETDPLVDSEKVIALGHSRLGKTALWAAAQDERFAMAISNNSGCGGAALSRRAIGETVQMINQAFPHWFCGNFKQYNNRENDLPVDQHMLLALIAPRPLYVASAADDLWADPKGEYLGAFHASAVYGLLGKEGLTSCDMPALDEPVWTTIGYPIRQGKHDITKYDWDRYLDFADAYFLAL